EPHESRRISYCAPLAWYVLPSSANASAPHSAMSPATPHASSASGPVPASFATPVGLKKIPTPMIAPMTTQLASRQPRTRAGWLASVRRPKSDGDERNPMSAIRTAYRVSSTLWESLDKRPNHAWKGIPAQISNTIQREKHAKQQITDFSQ